MTKSALGLVVVACWILTACQSDRPSVFFDDYLTRVVRVQNAPQVESTLEDYVNLPRKRDLYIEIPSISIGLLDSYQLRQCGLFNLIAERNSVLGKVADEFRNYDYQNALLDGLSRCINSPQLDPELQQVLAEIGAHKRAQLALHQWNLLFTSEAMQKQLQGSQWLEANLGQTVSEVNEALTRLNLAFHQSEEKTIDVQETLEKNNIVGNLNYSLVMATSKLNLVTLQLTEYDHSVLCQPNRNTTKYQYLNNVFEQQYVAKVQPYMAQLDRYYQNLSANLTLFAPQPDIHNYVYPLAQNHQAFRLAIRRHVDYWQQLFKRCGRQLG
ncbi:DUF3080 domain-containing protein [Vibrio sp. TRT 29B02]|uniref:DUF3080 domain-containing protein n=1 Tax=Vibrio sp. TRT 29B02 TaxID=3418508 RepID=UPI003CF1B500